MILSWQRAAVGIIRTELECARYLLKCDRQNYKFCRYDRHQGFIEVNSELVRHTLDRHDASLNVLATTTDHLSVAQFSFRKKLKQKLGFIYRPFSKLGSTIRSRSRSRRQHLHTQMCRLFQKGDVYIFLGIDWDNRYINLLYDLKRNQEFLTIQICYDVIPAKLPHLAGSESPHRYTNYFTNMARNADAIICISECSKRDLEELLKKVEIQIPQLEVIHLGCDLVREPANNTELPIRGLAERYILYVSTVDRRKNHQVLYNAYTWLIDNGRTNLPQLVFVGMEGLRSAGLLADIKNDPRIGEKIIWLNDVGDAELAKFYEGAYFTVFPSEYEGWGLAVVESLARGKFCIASSSSSLPEAGGEYAEYIHPLDTRAWADRLAYYADHPEAIIQHERKIRETFLPSSWNETARSILSVAERLRGS